MPVNMVPLNCLERFRVMLKDVDGEEHVHQFYAYDETDNVYRFARGNLDMIYEIFGNYGIQDQRSRAPMKNKLVFTGALKPHQVPVAEAIMAGNGYGQLNAPPRFGKTVTLTSIICQFGFKTLWMAHQIDLLKQALKTFHRFTNVMDLEYELGRPIVGIAKDWEDFYKYDVCFTTYQKFIQSFDRVGELKNTFGAVFVDECHLAKAGHYAKIVSAFNPAVKHGVSGTTEVKGDAHLINNFTLGPVRFVGRKPEIPCQVRLVRTNTRVNASGSGPRFFGMMLNELAKNQKRTEYVIDVIKAYAMAGHYIVAVSERVQHIDDIVKGLLAAGITAQAYHGKVFKNDRHREQILEDARSGKIRVLVSIRKMVLGLDIPRLTAFFNLLPSANPPNYYQEASRVGTEYPGKDCSYVVDFIDDHPIALACLKSRNKVYSEQGWEVVNKNEFPTVYNAMSSYRRSPSRSL